MTEVPYSLNYWEKEKHLSSLWPLGERFSLLYEYKEMLLEAGMGGFSDGEGIMETDLKDKNAVEVSRVKRR